MKAESAEQLARQIAEDPVESARLARIQVAPRAAAPRRLSVESAASREMRRLLDLDPDMAAITTQVLRSRDRSEHSVRLRVRAIRLLFPHFRDGEIGLFLRRHRSAISHLRKTRL